jgi:hypothetical protein
MRLLKLYTCTGKKSTGDKADFHKENQVFYEQESSERNGLPKKWIQKYPVSRRWSADWV